MVSKGKYFSLEMLHIYVKEYFMYLYSFTQRRGGSDATNKKKGRDLTYFGP